MAITKNIGKNTIGGKLNLPIYYRNKIFTEEEREKLFLDKIEKGIVYVLGNNQ